MRKRHNARHYSIHYHHYVTVIDGKTRADIIGTVLWRPARRGPRDARQGLDSP